MNGPRIAGILALALLATPALRPASARVIDIPPAFRVGLARADAGDGLRVRFKDVSDSCSLHFCRGATDTVTVQITPMPNINFLLNQGSYFGPFYHGGSYFETRWDSFLNIKVPGDYVFSIQVDDGASVAIGDSLILVFDGGHWFYNLTSDTVRFAQSGVYPLRAYFFDCPYCCRGFRMGGMGPAGSGMMAFTPGFNFDSDLGPCCTYGNNGPGVSVVPAALFFQTAPAVSGGSPPAAGSTASITGCSAAPNPCRGATVLAVELARGDRVWLEVFDAAGRRVSTLAAGEWRPAGVTRWLWALDPSSPGARASGSYFYRVRTADGSSAGGSVIVVR